MSHSTPTGFLRSLGSVGLLPVVLLLAPSAQAGDAAAAQALFDDATRLVAQQRIAEACPKFEESQRQDPGIGTLYHFADCEDRLGKTATAWAAFVEVAAEAKSQGQAARAKAAEDRAAALASRLARLTIEPGDVSGSSGLQLFRDGAPIGPGEWSTAIPVNPGSHRIEARAPGKRTWTSTVSSAPSSWLVVTIPPLAAASAPADYAASVSDPNDAPHPGRTQRVAGIVIGAAGLVGLGVGAYFGIESLQHHNDSNTHCVQNICDATGVSLRSDAQQSGTMATIALGAGGAALLTGIILLASAPRRHVNSAQSRPTLAIGPGSLLVQGTW